jgi:uncharacterized protein
MKEIFSHKSKELKIICDKNHVEHLFVFGSVLTDDFNENSDLDFAVLLKANLTPLEHGEAFLNLLSDLQELFNRKIDLISYRVVKNPVFKEELDRTKISLYAAA